MGFSTTFSGTMDLTGLGNTLEKALIFSGSKIYIFNFLSNFSDLNALKYIYLNLFRLVEFSY